jgi:hypothetical protein
MKSMANTLYMIALAIVGIFGAGLFLRPRVFATKSPTVEKVFVNQGTHILGGKLQLTVSVDNRSSFAVRDVKVAVDAPEVFDVESSELELGEVKLGTREQAEFELIPRGCALGTITGAVSYVNDIGNTKTVELDPVEVTSVFPFLKSKKLSKKAFAAKVKDVGHREATLRTDADPVRVIDIIRARCSPLYTVNESLAKERTKAVADYAALDAREGTFIGVRVRAEKKKGAEQSKVNFAVYGEDAELVRTMLDELEGLIGKADGS